LQGLIGPIGLPIGPIELPCGRGRGSGWGWGWGCGRSAFLGLSQILPGLVSRLLTFEIWGRLLEFRNRSGLVRQGPCVLALLLFRLGDGRRLR
jgi:hypothetical protein